MFNKRSDKKAQAAMEFLMTYGWAILIILVVLGALFYLGVFSPNISTSCTPFPPISSCDIKLIPSVAPAADTFELSIVYPPTINNVALFGWDSTANPAETDVASIEFDVGGADCDVDDSTDADRALVSGTAKTFTCTNVRHGLTTGDQYAGDVVLEYQLQGSTISHKIRLSITGTVEEEE
ncbi:hypothetical protein CL617_02090 [archaeon]|nr:hypothetical protein [archaeon]|tara:strand:- start:2329 stop:2868 length:540 start_codon:yes stop_codon:yes gene_type:complete